VAHLHSFGFAFGSWYGAGVDEVSGRGTVFPNIPNRCSSPSPSDAGYVKVSPRLAAPTGTARSICKRVKISLARECSPIRGFSGTLGTDSWRALHAQHYCIRFDLVVCQSKLGKVRRQYRFQV
jgi:hypothetical protein